MRYLDANIFVRFLTEDSPAKAQDCLTLFQRVTAGAEEVTTCEAILTEVVYVLSSSHHYNLKPDEIRARLVPLLMMRGLRLPQKRTYLKALDLYAAYSFLDFEDAVLAAHMQNAGLAEVYSYDTDFDRVPNVQRVEPPSSSK